MTKMSDVAIPSLLITEGTEPSAPAAGKQRLYIDSTSHKLKRTDSSGVDVTVEGGVASGTSFPGSPAADDRFYRTDTNKVYFYNGSLWLSEAPHRRLIPASAAFLPITGTTVLARTLNPGVGSFAIWVVNSVCGFLVAGGGTALSGSHKWVGVVNADPSTVLDTITIDSGSASVWRSNVAAVGANVASTVVELDVTWTKTGTPGNLYAFHEIEYREIG